MDVEAIREFCLQYPYTTENMQWGADLCFKVDGKLFVVIAIEMVPQRISFKCTPENFGSLCERAGIIPAPYMARAQWVSLERLNALPDAELREALAESYQLVWERLPKKRRAELENAGKPPTKIAPQKRAASKTAAKSENKKAARRT